MKHDLAMNISAYSYYAYRQRERCMYWNIQVAIKREFFFLTKAVPLFGRIPVCYAAAPGSPCCAAIQSESIYRSISIVGLSGISSRFSCDYSRKNTRWTGTGKC